MREKKSGHLQYMKKQADCPDSSDKEEERESCFANQGIVWRRESGWLCTERMWQQQPVFRRSFRRMHNMLATGDERERTPESSKESEDDVLLNSPIIVLCRLAPLIPILH